jgi:hypothetical protein
MTDQEELQQLIAQLEPDEAADALEYVRWLVAERDRPVRGYSAPERPRRAASDAPPTRGFRRRRDLRVQD